MLDYAAELKQEIRGIELSGLWDDRIPDETYCKYLRLDQESFLSPFGICAIAASFSLMVVVYSATSMKGDDELNVNMVVYDGHLCPKCAMRIKQFDSPSRLSDSDFPKHLEIIYYNNHFMALQAKAANFTPCPWEEVPGWRNVGVDGSGKENLLQSLLLGQNSCNGKKTTAKGFLLQVEAGGESHNFLLER